MQCVYGDSDLQHVRDCLIPALGRATSLPVRMATMNFDPRSEVRLPSGPLGDVLVVDVANTAATKTGFAANHNSLFRLSPPGDSFVVINPDCIPQVEAIDRLLGRRRSADLPAAIIEGRQWPFEHPKEYDPLTLYTPWASGAFSLIDSGFYSRVGGMDELYGLYLEDVDLSWQAWLNGYCVLYEPGAQVIHFSGGAYCRDDLVSQEAYLSLRNFLVISRKFFGARGEDTAVKMLRALPDRELADIAMDDYKRAYRDRVTTKYLGMTHPQVKILGVNRFHTWSAA